MLNVCFQADQNDAMYLEECRGIIPGMYVSLDNFSKSHSCQTFAHFSLFQHDSWILKSRAW